MKRTLIVATTSYAGMGPYVSEIVNTFSPEDDVYFLLYDYEDNFFQKNIKNELKSHCTFYKKANSSWNKLKSMLLGDKEFSNLVLELCRIKSIRVVHYICDPAPCSTAKILENKGIRVVGTVHDLEAHEAKKAPHKMLRAWISEKQRRKNTNYGKVLVTNGKAQYEKLLSMYPNKELYYHSFPSLVTLEIEKGTEYPPELANLDKPYILFFGRIEEYKGISYLYEAFVNTPLLNEYYYLVIAGKGEIGFERNKNEKNVIWIQRYVKDTEIKAMYLNAKCVVYPYISATQSGVLSIAYYYQTPVLASDVPFFKENIEKTGAGLLFQNRNVEDLKEKLLALLAQDVSMMKEKELECYKKNYQTSLIKDKLLEIYQK